MKTARRGCPLSLSFIFKAYLPKADKTPRNERRDHLSYFSRRGSTGVGCTFNRQAEVTVSEGAANKLYFNSKPLIIPTVWRAVAELTDRKMRIEINSPLPLGSGFGVSGASTLAALAAVNKLFGLKKKGGELALIAHYAEIREKTGLGTVATQITGGFLVKSAPGIPVKYKILPLTGKKIYAVYLGSYKTEEILKDRDKLSRINQFATRALTEINNSTKPSIGEIMDISYKYWKRSKIFGSKRAEKLVEIIKKQGGSATVAII